ncbi:hypothetical protein [Haloglomus litoreum]|uniref:hypothetical protein n=1 Tax=Haloglomus litoreum TaxID=3034026 RepID=UPI0023E885D6|nr:hypothetical protein [Haloglomus sp. DT116]
MLRRLRANGPALLVPAAWAVVIAAHVDLVATRTLLIAHGVMAVLLVGFAALSYREMREGILSVWWLVVAAGIPVTAAGLIGLVTPVLGQVFLPLAVGGWMLLPGVGLLETGREMAEDGPRNVYLAAGGLCLLGALVYFGGLFAAGGQRALVAGLVIVGVGQTAGIVDAVVRY